MPRQKAFQDYFPGNMCFGCGPANTKGLRLKSFWYDRSKKISICVFRPKQYHSAATPDALHGGIIASLADCPGIWLAIASAHEAERRKLGSSPSIWYVSRHLEIDYPKPTPLNREILIISKILEESPKNKKYIVESELWPRGQKIFTAKGVVVAVRVNFDEATIAKLSHHSKNQEEV